MQYAKVPVVPGPVTAVSPTIGENPEQWHSCGDAVEVEWEFNGSAFTPPPPPAPPPFVPDQKAITKGQAQAALDASDVTILRCVAANVAVPPEWVAYRADLRLIRASGVGPLPTTPAYPAGT